jgi:hypothetical protein
MITLSLGCMVSFVLMVSKFLKKEGERIHDLKRQKYLSNIQKERDRELEDGAKSEEKRGLALIGVLNNRARVERRQLPEESPDFQKQSSGPSQIEVEMEDLSQKEKKHRGYDSVVH